MKSVLRKSPLMMFILGFGLFAASCSASIPQPPTQVPVTAFVPATPTATVSPSATPQTESTPTRILTASVSPSATATPPLQGTLLFATPGSCDGVCYPQLTPIFTPEKQQVSYHLKPLAEKDFIALIHTLDQYAHDADAYGPAGSRYPFIENQSPVRFAVEEAQLHFPNSSYTDQYLWHLVYSHAIQGKPGVDEWLMQHIDRALNADGYSLDTLNNLLNPNGFNANDMHVVRNLFGDGKQGWVFNVKVK